MCNNSSLTTGWNENRLHIEVMITPMVWLIDDEVSINAMRKAYLAEST